MKRTLIILTILLSFISAVYIIVYLPRQLDNKYKTNLLSFNITEDYVYDDGIDEFTPKIDYDFSKDTLNIAISFVEYGVSSYDGGYIIKNDTLFLKLLDQFPLIVCSCDNSFLIEFKILLKDKTFSHIDLDIK